MKRYIALLLAVFMILGVTGCSGDKNAPGPAIENDAVVQTEEQNPENASTEVDQQISETQPEETAAPVEISGELYLTASELTFSVVGETEDIYCGTLPRDVVSWESADESVVLVNQGVVSAVGVGTTTVVASYKDQRMECTVGCLANDEEELAAMPADVLHAPRMRPPVGDGQPCHFYDDAAIVGDSVSYSLVLWATQTGEMGNPTFLVRGGNGIAGYVNRYKTISYQGLELGIDDAVAMAKPKKLFIMLGVNDLGFMSVEETMEYFKTMMDRILEKYSDMEIYLESLLPVWDAGVQGTKNRHVDAYNELLKEYAEEKGYHYLDVARYIKDHTGGMAMEYCSDMSTHMNYDGIDAWMQALKLYAKTQTIEEN